MTAKDLIREHEGLRLVAYPDPGTGGAPWTIAYGHTKGVRKGDTCTIEQAEAWLTEDMTESYSVVDRVVKVPLSEKQRDALCSFVFNVGPGVKGVKDGFVTLKSGKPSTMLKMLNEASYLDAANQFPRWNKAAGKVLPGLVKRRGKERALFLAGTNIPEPAFPQGDEMAPFLAAAIPALISALPEFAAIFKKEDVAARNTEAVVKASEIIMQATGAQNVQQAVEKVQADPEIAQAANEALRANRADLMDTLERLHKLDEDSIQAARAFYREEKPIFGGWMFVHVLSLLLVLMGGAVAVGVVFTSEDLGERTMALQTLLLVGFASVVAFWLGSSRSSQLKDLRDR